MKRDREIKDMLATAADFLRYTFTPAFSLVLLVCGFGAFAVMAFLFYRFKPLLAVVLFSSYSGFFLMAMIASFKKWKRYKKHYNNVFNK